LARDFPTSADIFGKLFDKHLKDPVRQRIVEEGIRPTVAASKDVRQITVEVGVLPAHARIRALHPRPDPGADVATLVRCRTSRSWTPLAR